MTNTPVGYIITPRYPVGVYERMMVMPCEHCLSEKKTIRNDEEKKKLINQLLRRHIEGCVVRDIKNGEEDIDELMDIIGKLTR